MRDEHCHIIWGVDDGASSFAQSCDMLDAAAAVGVTDMVATPHVRWDDFSQSTVVERFEKLRPMASERGIEMTLGYEVYFPRLVEMGLENATRFTLQNADRLLVEFDSGGSLGFGWERLFWELQTGQGLEITVAHPERYREVLADIGVAHAMKDMGCRIQVSAGDLFRGRFDKVARCAKKLIDEGLVDAIVSDAHRVGHYEDFAHAVKKWGRA